MYGRKLVYLRTAIGLLVAVVSCARVPPGPTPQPQPRPSVTATPLTLPTFSASPSATTEPAGSPRLLGQVDFRPLAGIGHYPQAIAESRGYVYVANRGTNNVSVIKDQALVAVIDVGMLPVDVAADASTGLVYVANEGDDTVTVLSGTRVVKSIPVASGPACLVAGEGRVYVGSRAAGGVTVLDGESGEPLQQMQLDAPVGVLALALNLEARLLYAATYNAVAVIDLKAVTVVRRLEREVYVTLGSDPASGDLLMGEYDPLTQKHHLVIYDAFGDREHGRMEIGADPRGMAVDAARRLALVANSWSNSLSLIDLASLQVLNTIRVGLEPVDVTVDGEGTIYAANSGSANVAVISAGASEIAGVVPLAMLPKGMAVDLSSGRVFLASASTNGVLVIEGSRVVRELRTGAHPTEVSLNAAASLLSVLNYADGDLMLLRANDGQIVRSLPVGERPQGLSAVPHSDELYASDLVVDGNRGQVVRQLELRTSYGSSVKPVEVQIDPQTGRAFAVASNGVPGSNGGLVIYVVEPDGKVSVAGQVGGLSTTGLALDSEGGRVYSTAGRFGSFQLIVNDAIDLRRLASISIPGYPAALAYNAHTNHLFICLVHVAGTSTSTSAELMILDSRGLGTVAQIAIPGKGRTTAWEDYELGVDSERQRIYLSDADRGVLWAFADAEMPPPATPAPTLTPTPWPTMTSVPEPTKVSGVSQSCDRMPTALFEGIWSTDAGLRHLLGCPLGEMQEGVLAWQSFERGRMIWREHDRTVLALFEDGRWRAVPDQWQDGMPPLSCAAQPPDGFVQPQRGFGLVWCKEQTLRAGLGWALQDELGAEESWQRFEQGEMITLRGLQVIYAPLSDGTFRIYPLF